MMSDMPDRDIFYLSPELLDPEAKSIKSQIILLGTFTSLLDTSLQQGHMYHRALI